MADAARNRNPEPMTEQTFTCPDCGQEISVNDSVRQAILANGCPVCTASVEESNFET